MPKRRRWRMQQGGFEEASRFSRRANGWKPADTTVFRIAEAPPVAYFSQQFFLFVSGGILFVNSDKKYAKNAV